MKDQATLMRAARLLAEEGLPYTLDIIGADTLDGEIQREAAALGVTDRVRFHGPLPQRELRPLVEAADVLLMSSRHEAGPVAVLEAAHVGVPTVGTAVGHIADWAPEAAVAVPVGCFRELARETAALLADDRRRLRIALAAQHRAVTSDADWTARRVSALYTALAFRNRPVP